MKEMIESGEYQRLIDIKKEKELKEQETLNIQLEKMHNRVSNGFDLHEFIIKVNNKYESSEYVNRCYKKGHMPDRTLLWFLYEYAIKYGRSCTEEEIEEYENVFTTDLVFLEDFYFMKIDGQGTEIILLQKN
jgi:hypothetical protein